ncbi:uncharacterized protein [Dipodomys merriami]|uniref:uncharacterized protein n=1 Tax=Dipodomys merriami TaxID=94247 RepID=UPI003855CFA3
MSEFKTLFPTPRPFPQQEHGGVEAPAHHPVITRDSHVKTGSPSNKCATLPEGGSATWVRRPRPRWASSGPDPDAGPPHQLRGPSGPPRQEPRLQPPRCPGSPPSFPRPLRSSGPSHGPLRFPAPPIGPSALPAPPTGLSALPAPPTGPSALPAPPTGPSALPAPPTGPSALPAPPTGPSALPAPPAGPSRRPLRSSGPSHRPLRSSGPSHRPLRFPAPPAVLAALPASPLFRPLPQASPLFRPLPQAPPLFRPLPQASPLFRLLRSSGPPSHRPLCSSLFQPLALHRPLLSLQASPQASPPAPLPLAGASSPPPLSRTPGLYTSGCSASPPAALGRSTPAPQRPGVRGSDVSGGGTSADLPAPRVLTAVPIVAPRAFRSSF